MEKLTLTNKSINLICEKLGTYLEQQHLDSKDIIRSKMSIEETLLNYQKKFGTDAIVKYSLNRTFGNVKCIITVKGESYDPFTEDSEDSAILIRGLFSNFAMVPNWQYKNGTNVITLLSKRKKMSTSKAILLALASACILGLISAITPESVNTIIDEQLVIPLSQTFIGLISGIASPMVFLSIAYGICSIGDVETFGKIGSKVIKSFLIWTFVLTAVLIIPALLVSNVTFDVTNGISIEAFASIRDMILDIIPDNLFQPFVANNPLQVIFWAVMFGTAALILGKRISIAYTVIEQFNSLVLLIMELISSIVPIFIFLCFYNIFLTAEIDLIIQVGKLIGITIGTSLLLIIIYFVRVCLKTKIKPMVFLKKVWPGFFVGLTTASSSAVFTTNIDTCVNSYGIDEKLVNFAVPLGQVIYMLGASAIFVCTSIFMAESYGISISPAWIISLILVSSIMSVAAPPIAGGTMGCFTILFMQLGIPMEALGLALAANAILDFIGTATNVVGLHAENIMIAKDLKLIDLNTLRKQREW